MTAIKAISGTIETNARELNLTLTLKSGQAFRWRPCSGSGGSSGSVWVGVVDNRFVFRLTQSPDKQHITYEVLNADIEDRDVRDDQYFRELIAHYLRLDVSASDLYDKWSQSDANFAAIAVHMKGIRIMRQNLIETLFSFICSSNNNISRIETMIERMCQKYGHVLYESPELGSIHSFPDVRHLAEDSVAAELKRLGFGYRSKYIESTAKAICHEYDSPLQWATTLQAMPYSEAKDALTRLPGVGPKVADCIALMALGHLQAIPVDIHVLKIARNQYLPHLKKNKTLTHRAYNEIADFFRSTFGESAGWAQAVLFCADLKPLKPSMNAMNGQ
ncbi:unnamed protein product [Oppiella nova]|uniref:N-glycosylase/DNA lyase n=1 Tax=Oppiella nova TaxID=334625 RepID=A0A7R9L9V5_9ACAR|nr:unnamed protein product [Oppiella nova]CAG2161295.1 unnamed protein product [Oppiella nova]